MEDGRSTVPLTATSTRRRDGVPWYEDGGRLTEDDEPDPSGDEVPDWNGSLDGDSDSYWSWDSDLCQRNVSEFEGIWYYDGDLSAETYIVIDGNGNWSYYQRPPALSLRKWTVEFHLLHGRGEHLLCGLHHV